MKKTWSWAYETLLLADGGINNFIFFRTFFYIKATDPMWKDIVQKQRQALFLPLYVEIYNSDPVYIASTIQFRRDLNRSNLSAIGKVSKWNNGWKLLRGGNRKMFPGGASFARWRPYCPFGLPTLPPNPQLPFTLRLLSRRIPLFRIFSACYPFQLYSRLSYFLSLSLSPPSDFPLSVLSHKVSSLLAVKAVRI